MNYQHLPLVTDDDVNQILRIDGDSQITINLEVDSDYKTEYEAWVAEGNTPLAAPSFD
tara:strand:+ start:363 stop:536 length:174 start_codon:yes stop_codon:yes gene_type:complete